MSWQCPISGAASLATAAPLSLSLNPPKNRYAQLVDFEKTSARNGELTDRILFLFTLRSFPSRKQSLFLIDSRIPG